MGTKRTYRHGDWFSFMARLEWSNNDAAKFWRKLEPVDIARVVKLKIKEHRGKPVKLYWEFQNSAEQKSGKNLLIIFKVKCESIEEEDESGRHIIGLGPEISALKVIKGLESLGLSLVAEMNQLYVSQQIHPLDMTELERQLRETEWSSDDINHWELHYDK